MPTPNITDVIARPEYAFLHENEHLRDRILFVTFGGSHAYGTANENSDIDIRGCTAASASDLLGLTSFEQYADAGTDTTIFAFPKLMSLLLKCNPHVIEMLGCRPETYAMVSPAGRLLLDNRKLFLSQRCIRSFGEYAAQQFARLENAVAHRQPDEAKKEAHILRACQSAMARFSDRYQALPEGGVTLHINEESGRIVMDASLHSYPLRDYACMLREMNDIARNFSTLDKRNRKKDDLHLNKHMMHLVRLYLTGIDILEQGDIITYREKDHDLLISIRNGNFMDENGLVLPEFYDMLNEVQAKFNYAKERTSLPREPDSQKANDLAIAINRQSLA